MAATGAPPKGKEPAKKSALERAQETLAALDAKAKDKKELAAVKARIQKHRDDAKVKK